MLLLIPVLLITIGASYVIARFLGERLENSKLGDVIRFTSTYSQFLPAYWIAMVILLASIFTNPSSYGEFPQSYFAPFFALTIALFGQIFCSLSQGMRIAQKKSYVGTSRIKGLSDNVILTRYIMRNGVLRLVSSPSALISTAITSDILVEFVFNYHGVGNLMAGAFIARDYPLLYASFFYLTIFVILISLSFDIVRLRLDPVLQYDEKENEIENTLQISNLELSPDLETEKATILPVCSNLDDAFGMLETCLIRCFPELPVGFTWNEALLKLKAIGIDADWDIIESVFNRYQAHRFGGFKLGEEDLGTIMKLVRIMLSETSHQIASLS